MTEAGATTDTGAERVRGAIRDAPFNDPVTFIQERLDPNDRSVLLTLSLIYVALHLASMTLLAAGHAFLLAVLERFADPHGTATGRTSQLKQPRGSETGTSKAAS